MCYLKKKGLYAFTRVRCSALTPTSVSGHRYTLPPFTSFGWVAVSASQGLKSQLEHQTFSMMKTWKQPLTHVRNHSIPCGMKMLVNPGTSCEESFNPLWCEDACEPRNIMWGIIQSLVVWRCLWTQEHHARNHSIHCDVKMLVNPGTSCEESFNPLWHEDACEPRNIMRGIIQSIVMWRCLWTQEHHARNHSIHCDVKMLVNPGTSCEESFNPLWYEDAGEPRNIMWEIIQSLVMWRCLWTQEHHVRNHSIPCGVKRLMNQGTLIVVLYKLYQSHNRCWNWHEINHINMRHI